MTLYDCVLGYAVLLCTLLCIRADPSWSGDVLQRSKQSQQRKRCRKSFFNSAGIWCTLMIINVYYMFVLEDSKQLHFEEFSTVSKSWRALAMLSGCRVDRGQAWSFQKDLSWKSFWQASHKLDSFLLWIWYATSVLGELCKHNDLPTTFSSHIRMQTECRQGVGTRTLMDCESAILTILAWFDRIYRIV